MAQSFTAKEQSFVNRASAAFTQLMAAADTLGLLASEASNNFYLSGGANVLTDAVVQGALPAATAAQVFSAFGALSNASAILATIASNRQALEAMRP